MFVNIPLLIKGMFEGRYTKQKITSQITNLNSLQLVLVEFTGLWSRRLS